MITRITYQELNTLNQCDIRNFEAPTIFPYAGFNLTQDDIFKHDKAKDTDIIVLFFSHYNYPLKQVDLTFKSKGWNEQV